MRPHPGNRVITSRHVGDDSVVIVGIKPSPIPHLPARLRIKRRVIENDLALLTRLQFLHALPIVDDRQHLATIRARLPVTLKLRLRQLLVRRIRRLLRRPLPRSPRPRLLLIHRAIESSPIKLDSLIARRILHEVEGHAERVVKFESVFPRELIAPSL